MAGKLDIWSPLWQVRGCELAAWRFRRCHDICRAELISLLRGKADP